jgi:hypothetical protein
MGVIWVYMRHMPRVLAKDQEPLPVKLPSFKHCLDPVLELLSTLIGTANEFLAFPGRADRVVFSICIAWRDEVDEQCSSMDD